LAPLSSLEVYKEVFVDEDLVEVSENLMGALLVLFKGCILETLKLCWEMLCELQYLLKEEDPLHVTYVDILELIDNMVDLFQNLLNQFCGRLELNVRSNTALLDHVDVFEMLERDFKVLDSLIIKFIEPREPFNYVFEALGDLHLNYVDKILAGFDQQAAVIREE